MYRQGKWLIHLRNKYGYHSVFRQKIFSSPCGPYDHQDFFKLDALRGIHDTRFDIQNVELHLPYSKRTPNLRFGINHPIAWIYDNEFNMITKDATYYTHPSLWSDELCYILFFLCIQELSRRNESLRIHKKSNNKSHQKAIITTLFVLHTIVAEAKRRNLYF
jgi:hypothetical protein